MCLKDTAIDEDCCNLFRLITTNLYFFFTYHCYQSLLFIQVFLFSFLIVIITSYRLISKNQKKKKKGGEEEDEGEEAIDCLSNFKRNLITITS